MGAAVGDIMHGLAAAQLRWCRQLAGMHAAAGMHERCCGVLAPVAGCWARLLSQDSTVQGPLLLCWCVNRGQGRHHTEEPRGPSRTIFHVCVCWCVLRAAGLPHLVVGTDNSLQAFDPQTMLLKWYVVFDTPPVSAYRPDGRGGNALDPEQAGRAALGGGSTGQDGSSSWLVPSPSSPRARPPMPAGRVGGRSGVLRRKVKGHLVGGTSVLVGALHGSLYALPADHLMLSAAVAGAAGEDGASSTGPAGTAAVVWPKRTGRMPLDITPAVVDVCAAGKQQLPGPSGAAGGSADGGSSGGGGPNSSDEGDGGSALALLDDSDGASGVVQLNPVDSGAVLDELGTLTCPQPPLGIHSISVQQGQQVGWLPLAVVQEVSSSSGRGCVFTTAAAQQQSRLLKRSDTVWQGALTAGV